MKRSSTLFLRIVTLFVAITTVVCMLWFPLTEGRATNLDLVSIYKDPFILYLYIASIPFFVGLYQAFKLLHFIDMHKAFSKDALRTLKIMKLAAVTLIGFIILALLYIHFFVVGEDPAGPTMLGIIATFMITVIVTAVTVFEKLLQHAIDIKSENDLTV